MNGGALKLDRDKLIRAREMLGYGLEKTAEEAGVSKNSVLRAEHEEDIRPVTARKIAGALGVQVADLIGGSETLKVQAPPSPTQAPLNGFEDERRAVWEAGVDKARRLREGGRARVEKLIAAWQASRARGELSSARRKYKEEIEQLFNGAYGATHTLADILVAEGGIPAPDDWEEVIAADRFYRTLIEMMRNAGFLINERKYGPPEIEEQDVA
jgi:transcriptional regulator with XRE-family HTH domain